MSTGIKEGTTEISRSIRWRMDLKRDWEPLQPEIHILHRGKTTISALDWKGGKPPLLMLHASGLSAGAFAPLAERLSRFCRPIAVDLRGHGGSTPPKKMSDFSYKTLAGDVLAMLDALGIRSAHGFGQSLGGGVLLRAAIERPCLFESLMTCEGTATPTHSAPGEARARRRIEGTARIQTVWKEKQELVSHYSQKRPFDRFAPEALRAFADWGLSARDDGQFELTCSPETQAGYNNPSRSAIETDWIDQRIAEIPAAGTPCTVLRGRRSSIPEECHEKHVQVLQARSVQIDGGPFLPQEAPERVAEVIRRQIGPSSESF